MQNVSHLVQGEHFQIQGRKNVSFSTKSWPHL